VLHSAVSFQFGGKRATLQVGELISWGRRPISIPTRSPLNLNIQILLFLLNTSGHLDRNSNDKDEADEI
jgi:hypothetical protein